MSGRRAPAYKATEKSLAEILRDNHNNPLTGHSAGPLGIRAAILNVTNPDYPEDGGHVRTDQVANVEALLQEAINQATEIQARYNDGDTNHQLRIDTYASLLSPEVRPTWNIQ